MEKPKAERVAHILGIGLDGEDGHVRITQGKDFNVLMGSEENHDRMMEACMRIRTRLDQLGLELNDLTREEFIRLVSELD